LSQVEVNNLRLSIIKRRKLEISLLEKKRDDIINLIVQQKEFLIAYEKTIPTVEVTH